MLSVVACIQSHETCIRRPVLSGARLGHKLAIYLRGAGAHHAEMRVDQNLLAVGHCIEDSLTIARRQPNLEARCGHGDRRYKKTRSCFRFQAAE